MKTLKFSLIVFSLILFQCNEDDTPIVEPDPSLISISDLSVDEGGDYTSLSVQLKLDVAAEQEITANISTVDGTAESGKDYIALSNQAVIIAVGETEKSFELTIAGDMIFEEDEHFEIKISSLTGPATIDDGTARVDLINDDVEGIQEVLVNATIDWSALENIAPGTELPYDLFNFGQPSNIPNAEYTSVGALNDTIVFAASDMALDDTLLYRGIFFEPGFNWPIYVDLISEPVNPGDSVELEVLMPIIGDDINDVEFKYDIHIMIGTPTGRLGPFIIDPKIRIPN